MVYLPTVHVHLVDFYGTPRETYQSHGSYEKGKSFSSYCFKGKVLVSGSVTATSNLIRKSKQNNFNLLHLQGLESESPGYPASRIYKGENYYASSKSVPGFSSDIITHRMHGTGILYLPTNLPSKNAPYGILLAMYHQKKSTTRSLVYIPRSPQPWAPYGGFLLSSRPRWTCCSCCRSVATARRIGHPTSGIEVAEVASWVEACRIISCMVYLPTFG